MTVTTIPFAAEMAEMGKSYGKSIGSWVILGDVNTEKVRAILDGFDDGDPEIMDMCPSSLSGEFADGPTVYSVIKAVGLDPHNAECTEYFDALIDIYEDNFTETFWETVISACNDYMDR